MDTTPAVAERGSRRDIVNRLAATIVCIATLAMIGTCLVLWGGIGFPPLPMSFVRGPVGVIEVALIAAVYVSIGAFLVGRVPGFLVGWGLVVIGVGVGLHLPISLLIGQAVATFRPMPELLIFFAWGLTSVLVPFAAMLIAMIVMILPDGRIPSYRWRPVIAVTLVGFLLLTIGSAITPSGLIWFPTLPNPLALPPALGPAATVARVFGVGLLALGLGLAVACLLSRYRAGDAELRRQIAWILAGAVFWAISLAALLVSRYALAVSDAAGTALTHVTTIGTLAVPITIFVATVRYHLFGAEVMVSRTLVYVPLLAICSGIYAAGVALSQRLFVSLTGNTSDVAIILATLMAAGAIMPLRRWLETVVDRAMPAARAGQSATASAQPDDERDKLTGQAANLSAKLAAIEARLADLDQAGPRDSGVAVGEPGVGRYVLRADAEMRSREPINPSS